MATLAVGHISFGQAQPLPYHHLK